MVPDTLHGAPVEALPPCGCVLVTECRATGSPLQQHHQRHARGLRVCGMQQQGWCTPRQRCHWCGAKRRSDCALDIRDVAVSVDLTLYAQLRRCGQLDTLLAVLSASPSFLIMNRQRTVRCTVVLSRYNRPREGVVFNTVRRGAQDRGALPAGSTTLRTPAHPCERGTEWSWWETHSPHDTCSTVRTTQRASAARRTHSTWRHSTGQARHGASVATAHRKHNNTACSAASP